MFSVLHLMLKLRTVILMFFTLISRRALKRYSLPGMLPPQLVKLPYLKEIDLSLNYLNGTIPGEWGAMQLTKISLLVNRLSGEIPKELGNITTLTYLTLEANQFSGVVPPELGNLINLGTLMLSSNRLTGKLPVALARLRNLTDFRINDNNFNGTIPDFIQNWEKLERLEMHASGLQGPIPSNISLLSNLQELRISDIKGPQQGFPTLTNMTGLVRLVLRNCNISGEIPPYIWTIQNLEMLDVSFNKLVGEVPDTINLERLRFLILTGNSLSGSVPGSIFKDGSNVDLSYNNFTWQGPEQRTCQDNINLNLNLFRSSSTENNLRRGLPCLKDLNCPRYSKDCSNGESKGTAHIVAGAVVGAFGLVFVILGILWWKGYMPGKRGRKKDRGLDGQTGTFTLKQLKAATNDFDSANKIGEGGFGPVYKGQLPDGTVIAVKQLSSKSRQGNREFLNEMGMISCFQHPNLVKLHGCCIDGGQLLLVYEYMENNNLARALLGRENHLKLDWPTRRNICIGIARGLAFLHEESVLKIVHRDIKATNVLLDRDLNAKISDFGLAKLDEEEKTHMSTRVAGTIGYMAPEYALWGHLTYKADVYSFGVVALEIISGKNNNNYIPSDDWVCLLDWACHLQQTGNLLELVDEKLGSEFDQKEAEIMVKVALICTNASASLRPSMSEVVSMLEGQTPVPDVIPEPSTYIEDLRFKAMRDLHRQRQDHSLSISRTQHSTTVHTFESTSTSGLEFSEINPDSTPS
ncbi:hypothetical protein PRUPE_4G069200 [Prunus persica]|uniref:Protein kinase domain-containing protein n=1 Tax=Prunus persica TaxID=3760 RepID=A0A251PGV6_PRUPE|nr:hypothetical protein PRUPE_4G069200 [Prunus persica]